jgi:Ca-activated chloride channel family protein
MPEPTKLCRLFRIIAAGILIAACLGLHPPSAKAQDTTTGPVIKSRVFVVNLFVTATSGKEYIRDLQKEDFSIYENGDPQEIKYFNNLSQSKDLPLTIALLVDTSASVTDKLQQEKVTASAFFKQIVRRNKDMVTLLEFHSEVILTQDFTDDPDRLDRALAKMKPGGNTSLYDAVYLAAEEKLKDEAGRKVIVILSDGEDTASKVSLEDAIKAAQKNDVLIYGLGVRSRNYPADFRALEKFCKETGGKFFSPSASIDQLKRTFEAIQNDMNHQYNIAYEPKNQTRDGSYRDIKVNVRRKGLKLFYRQGYYAPED